MKLFTNPYRTIRDLKSDVALAKTNASHWYQEYWDLYDVNAAHQDTNGKLRADIDNLEAKVSRFEYLAASDEKVFDELYESIAQDERAIFFHMEEREDLLAVIGDLEDEVEELAGDLEELAGTTLSLLATAEKQDADIKQANALLIEGSQAYDAVVAAGEQTVTAALQGVDGLRKELVQANWAYESLNDDFNQVAEELKALKTSNTQSLSWVRQAEEALEAYGIRIDDTPVGPVVLIDRDVFINRVALDNVTTGVN